MSKVLEKRNSLERFIREQTFGPGISGYRYVDLTDEDLLQNKIIGNIPLENDKEIIDIVPAAVYSTGVLFPIDNSSSIKEGLALDNNEVIEEDEEGGKDSQENLEEESDLVNGVEINQMYPSNVAITCCLDSSILKKNKIEFDINFRYYKKLQSDKGGEFNKRYGVLCECNVTKIRDFITKHTFTDFVLSEHFGRHYLTLNKMSADNLVVTRKRLIDIQKSYAQELYKQTKVLINLEKITEQSAYLSNLKSSIYYELKKSVIDVELRKKLYIITQEIEQIESIGDHFKNLFDVYSGGYGLWQSETIQKKIVVENLILDKKKKVLLHNKPETYKEKISVLHADGTITNSLKNIFLVNLDEKGEDFASLSLNLQFTKDSRKESDNIFFKIQLLNTSKPVEKDPKGKRYYSTFNEKVNEKAFFGVRIRFQNDYLRPYSNANYILKDGVFDEDTTTKFIYNQFKDFGIGHGCSVIWNEKERFIESEYLPTSETPDVDPIPRNKEIDAVLQGETYNAPVFLSNANAQSFKWLSQFSDATNNDVLKSLNEFVDSYGKWIDIKKSKYTSIPKFSDIATQELSKCASDYSRMKNNISNFLTGINNEENLESFRLMNSAMFMQLWHSEKNKKNEITEEIKGNDFKEFDFDFYKNNASDFLFSPTEPASWRAFQLAFILLNLDGIFQLENDEKWLARNELVDLVWFPTGGGKTEAYLGLIALTIINRRKKFQSEGGGTAVIMRYTLRLLTMQQFQRASLVIMALELMRRWDLYKLGDEPITIGLWVGDNSLPNKTEDLITEFEKLNHEKPNKIPFSKCPWCGSKLIGGENEDDDASTSVFDKNKVHLKCENHNKCNFGYSRPSRKKKTQGSLPLLLSDEIIYQHPPTLLFGTVDKFAQLEHKVDGDPAKRNKDSRRLFGRGNWETGKPAEGYLAPDLIIQDELHLLLGPLGSAVALFESAVDILSKNKFKHRPKVISSTATTRNTQLQIAALFDREVNLFPKPGVECDDSFFAFYKRQYSDTNKNNQTFISKRKYMGILPTGRSQVWMQMRLSAIVMTHRAIFELQQLNENSPIEFEKYDRDTIKAMDYYHTLISYFNSLKEVGKTQSQVQSYILKEVRRVFSRVVRPCKLMHSFYTYGPINEAELTGRLSGEEVKTELKKVEESWDAAKRLAFSNGGETLWGKVPPEFIVATNMISVGIDVSRFNTIIMNSMPRNTAEYIQASSRVGRNDYGLVLTVHHPFRARDISHYERFIEFHEKMYSYVEPISITPFTKKAVDRYLSLFFATLVRHRLGFENRKDASKIADCTREDITQILNEIKDYFEQRKSNLANFEVQIQNLLKEQNLDIIVSWVSEAIKEWENAYNLAVADSKEFVFSNKKNTPTTQQEQLYIDIEEYIENIESKKWQVPMSLRVIEPEAAIKINSY
ncbi:helicase [Chryseobacterium sp. NEB161]|nr:helicase [Chryseobacterium sp. NEB161]